MFLAGLEFAFARCGRWGDAAMVWGYFWGEGGRKGSVVLCRNSSEAPVGFKGGNSWERLPNKGLKWSDCVRNAGMKL